MQRFTAANWLRVFASRITTGRLAFALLAVAAAGLALTVSSPTAGAPVPGNIATFAGSDAGDGGPATNATLDEPEWIAATSTGDMYVMDSWRCRIRKVSGGIITNVAGNGTCEYSSDGSVAASSAILPTAIAAGPGGVLYFTEASGASGPVSESCRVRKVVGGLIATVGGNGSCGSPVNGTGATATPLEYPTLLAVDGSGNAYVSGIIDCQVWKIVPGGVITRVVGDGCGLTFDPNPLTAMITPVSIAVDSTGANIYVAENNSWSQCYIVRVSGGVLSQFAGAGLCYGDSPDGPVAGVRIAPRDIEVGSTGDVFFVDGCSARKISGGMLSTVTTCVAGATPYLEGLMAHRVAVRGAGDVWMADVQNCRVAHLNGNVVEAVAGGPDCGSVGDGGAAVYATLSGSQAVGVDGAGNVYIADLDNSRVRKVAGGNISTVAGSSTAPATYPPIGVGVPATDAAVSASRLEVAPGGGLYIADAGCRLRVISGGLITTIAGSGGCGTTIGDGMAAGAVQFYEMAGIAVSPGGAVYESDRCRIWSVDAGVVHLVARDGTCASTGDGGAAVSAELNEPFGLAVSGGDLYVAERDGCRIRKISGGIITTVAGDPGATSCGYSGDGGAATSAQLDHPTGVAVDSGGALYIGDTGNCRVRKVQGGIITTVAGNGVCGFGGDGGPATLASLGTPPPGLLGLQFLGVAVAASGDLYIADPGNERIRIVYAPDGDADGVSDLLDNCPSSANAGQENFDGDAVGDVCDPDDDNDACGDVKESLLVPATDPRNPWDFYSVPIPALAMAPDPASAFVDDTVAASDAQAVFGYFMLSAKTGVTAYEQDLNANGVRDGLEYDRSFAGPGQSGAPDGIIAASDAQLAFAQFGRRYKC